MSSFISRFAKLSSGEQGAVDFIFGQTGQAYFGGNVIAVSSKGCVTASGRASNDNTSCRCSEQPWLLQVDLLICGMKTSLIEILSPSLLELRLERLVMSFLEGRG